MIEQAFQVEKKKIANRVVLQPMEGCDCNPDGSPSGLTIEKYRKAARSGAGLVWLEANAVCPEGRTNPRQMMLTRENIDQFKKLVADMSGRMESVAYGIDESNTSEDSVMYATMVFSIVPMLVLYPFVQKFFIKGIMLGGVKG